MFSFTPFARWFARRGQRRPLTPTRGVPFRPTLEALETRNLLSTLAVTNLSDTGVSGDGSLRGEIAAAANGDRIVFAPSLAGQTITLNAANGPLALSKSLTIQGLGADQLTICGNNATEVFRIAAGATDTITGLTIADGNADRGDGGGILNAGTLTLDDSTLSGNHADGGEGGGIFNDFGGTVTIDHSILFGNRADGGAGGGVFNQGTLTLDFSALVGNSAPTGADLDNVGGTVTLHHSFVGERADG